MSQVTIHVGDALSRLRAMPSRSVHMIATSPPYWGLRDYGAEGQIGLEETPKEYVAKLVRVFREGRRVLRDDGTLWLNLGDCYAGNPPGNVGDLSKSGLAGARSFTYQNTLRNSVGQRRNTLAPGLKPKDLVGIPWTVALALRASGWWLRSDCIWAKGACMPENVTDRPTKSHEYVFLLSKSERYFYDDVAVRETAVSERSGNLQRVNAEDRGCPKGTGKNQGSSIPWEGDSRNMRTVWHINPQPFSGAHFATFPPSLPERCIKAGTSEAGACVECGAPLERVTEREGVHGSAIGKSAEKRAQGLRTAISGASRSCSVVTTVGWKRTCGHEGPTKPCVVLDPFGGAGTTALVAARLQRDAVLVELNPKYAQMAADRVAADLPMFTRVEVLSA